MGMSRNHLPDVEDFLKQRRIALAGLSSHEEHFSRHVDQALRERGYEVVVLRDDDVAVDERPTYQSLADVQPPIDGVLVMTPAEASAGVVRDALAAGVTRIWLHRGGGPGAVSEEAMALARDAGATLVAGECPMMFLEDAEWFHRLHAFGKKIVGSYPDADT